MQSKYKLTIAMRIYPGISKTPVFYSNNKFKLVELSLQSLKLCIGTISTKIYFILDGCPIEYEELVLKYFSKENTSIEHTHSIGNNASFRRQLEILSSQTDSEYIYFAEDDYLYRPGQFESMIHFMEANENIDFITCYDHQDYYSHPIHNYEMKTMQFESFQWKSVCSTCCTFLSRRDTLNKTMKHFMTYSKGNNDCAMWLSLTKKHIYNPFAYIKFFFKNKEAFNILKTGIKYGFVNYFRFKEYHLWVRVPSVATHLESFLLAPHIDWEQVKNEVETAYQ